MESHFIFEPGEWLGAGQVTFSMSPDLLYFRTKWVITEKEEPYFHCIQTVEIVGGDRMANVFSIMPKTESTFDITLENELLGTFSGTGVIEEKLVAWEFRMPGQLEGFEVYERMNDSEYSMHAEYISSDGARTNIRGKIWKRTTELE